MIKPRDSLRRSIVLAYVTFAAVATVFFAVVAVIAVEGIEEYLVDQRLRDVAEWASPRHAGGLPTSMPAGMTFHHGDEIPGALRNLSPGNHDITVDGVDLHVLKASDALGPYVVVDHESAYERIELVVYSLFAVGFLGFLGMSLVLGGYIGRKVVQPITELADAVRAGAPELPSAERDDELGVLAQAFTERTAELRHYLDRERFFTGDVSHELRTPLTVIIGAAEIVSASTTEQPAVQAAAQRILRAANEAAECVHMLLMLARSPQLIEQSSSDAASVAEAEVARYQALVDHKPVQLRYLGGASFPVRGPRELSGAAIGNLIRNACLYTERGEVTVALTDHTVLVDDTGPGLPEQVRATLGNGNLPVSTGSSGTGIGLTLVQRICEHLGARLSVEDRPGGGTRFRIEFPDDLTKS